MLIEVHPPNEIMLRVLHNLEPALAVYNNLVVNEKRFLHYNSQPAISMKEVFMHE